MKLAELQGMETEALKRLARSRGVPGAAALERPALIAALATLADEPASAGLGSEQGKRSRWDDSEVDGEPPHRRHSGAAAPTSVLPARPTDYDSEVMARVYLEQGHPERAAEIYRQLLAASPHDEELAELLAEAERLAEEKQRTQKRRRPTAAPHPTVANEPIGMLDLEELPEAYGIDEIEVLFKDPYTIFAYWEITDAGMSAARARLGDEASEAHLVLRLFSSTGAKGELGHMRDYPVSHWRGRRYLPTPRAGVRVRAATGLLAPSGLFALIANSSVVRVPPAEAAPYEPHAIEWMEVSPLKRRPPERVPIEMSRPVPAPGGVPSRPIDSGQGVAREQAPGGPAAGDTTAGVVGPPSPSPTSPAGPPGAGGLGPGSSPWRSGSGKLD